MTKGLFSVHMEQWGLKTDGGTQYLGQKCKPQASSLRGDCIHISWGITQDKSMGKALLDNHWTERVDCLVEWDTLEDKIKEHFRIAKKHYEMFERNQAWKKRGIKVEQARERDEYIYSKVKKWLVGSCHASHQFSQSCLLIKLHLAVSSEPRKSNCLSTCVQAAKESGEPACWVGFKTSVWIDGEWQAGLGTKYNSDQVWPNTRETMESDLVSKLSTSEAKELRPAILETMAYEGQLLVRS